MSRYPRKNTAYGGFTLPSGQTIALASGAALSVASGASIALASGADLNVAEGADINLAGVGADVAMTSDVGVAANAGTVAHVAYAAAAQAVTNRYVASANMKVGAYTLANGGLPGDGHAHHVTVSHTAAGAADTLGTIDIVGTNLLNEAITETITPLDGTIAHGAKAFKSVTSVTGVGWVIGEGNDTIVVGFGDKLGLPYLGTVNTVVAAAINSVREATAPAVVRDADEIEKNTIDLSTNLAGTAVDVWLVV